jgi:hypothetical protein
MTRTRASAAATASGVGAGLALTAAFAAGFSDPWHAMSSAPALAENPSVNAVAKPNATHA